MSLTWTVRKPSSSLNSAGSRMTRSWSREIVSQRNRTSAAPIRRRSDASEYERKS